MAPSLNGTPTGDGVVTVPTTSVHLDIQEQVRKSLAGLPEGRTMAVLNVTTQKGINLAIAHKLNDHFEVVGYIGKSGWDQPVEGGVAVAFAR